MSQEQPERPRADRPIAYGEVFGAMKAASSSSKLDQKPLAPRNAVTVQRAENDQVLGEEVKGAAVSKMAAVVDKNEKSGFVSHGDATDATGGVVGKPSSNREGSITIGEALEATVLTAGNKPVEWSDAAAIQAAEVRATGRTNIMPGGVAASAQSAATFNAKANSDEKKTTLAEVLKGAASKLVADKPATRKDAEGVTGAEMRNDPHLTTYPTGVAASIAAAARINQSK